VSRGTAALALGEYDGAGSK